jgi:hypothetical protein
MPAHSEPRPARDWTGDDDAHLDAILALRELWRERRGRVRLADCQIDARLVTFVVAGLCHRHGQFVAEWSGRTHDPLPLEARCPAGEGARCDVTSPVFVLV